MRYGNTLKIIAVVHGKSEYQICSFIKNELRLGALKILADKKGQKSIQITSLRKFFDHNIHLRSEEDFKREFNNCLELDEEGKPLIPEDLKIYTIMDTDDCSPKQKAEYKNKKMFEGHWAYEYIEPIFNDDNLEQVLLKADIKIKSKKKDYVEIFPTTAKHRQNGAIELKDFKNKLSKISDTNMNEFVVCCLDEAEKNKFNNQRNL